MDKVKYLAIFEMMKLAYRSILRDLLVKSIDDPDAAWDDFVLKMVDNLFGYDG